MTGCSTSFPTAAAMSETRVDLKRRYYVAGKRFDATVRVMSVAEGWAMCRYRGCMPFLCRVDELRPADE